MLNTTEAPVEVSERTARLKRRGLAAAIGALTALVLGRLSAQPAEAADGQALVIGAANSGTNGTSLTTNTGSTGAAFVVSNSGGTALFGSSSTSNAVTGQSTSGLGVLGTSQNSIGVAGQSSGYLGVQGVSSNSAGVYGNSTSSIGVWGQSGSNLGVFGFSSNFTGVQGQSAANPAVVGLSSSSFGVAGQSSTSVGVYGLSNSSVGVYGQSGSGLAGQFQGDVFVSGALTVSGIKSAAVPHPDGSHRRLYCVESPESYFEDVGEGRVIAGRADVRLDADFAAIVTTSNYHVFLTPLGECQGLYVTDRSPTGFTVLELQGGKSTISFSYRVMARRRDVPASRLPRVDVPSTHQPTRPVTMIDPDTLLRPTPAR